MWIGRTTPRDSALSSPTPATSSTEWPSQEVPGSVLTASAPVSDVSAHACTNWVWPPLRPVSVAQNNKLSTMLSSNVQSIDLPMDCLAWRFWTMRQLNGCSTPAPRSSAAKQCFQQLAQNKWKKRKGNYSFPAKTFIELLLLNSSALWQLLHETTNDLKKLETHQSISTRRTKGEKGIVDLLSAALQHNRDIAGIGMGSWNILSLPRWQ